MRYFRLILLSTFMALIAACGGGSSYSGGGTTTYAISGTITGPHASGVTVALTGTASASTTTASDGTYSFTGLANGTYTVVPSLSGYTFTAVSAAVIIASANVTGTNFTETTAVATTYTLSGTVSGAQASGVLITLSGTASGTTHSASDGTYSFTGLANGAYTVAPSLSGYNLSPASASVTIASASSTGINFTSTIVPATYSISGSVSGAVSGGVTITLTGVASATTTTASDGTFSLTGLVNGGYTLTPTLAGYTFAPNSKSVTVNGANLTGQTFVATANAAPTYTLSGTVTGTWVQGVTMTLGGAGSGTATTNASGNYSFSGLVAGTYTLTPALTGYSFSATTQSVPLSANTTATAFVATPVIASYSVSGTVTYAGAQTGRTFVYVYNSGCSGCSNAIAATSMTTTGGNYTIRGLSNGTYVVKANIHSAGTGAVNAVDPSGSSGTFTVSSANVSGINVTAVDHTASVPAAPTGLLVSPGSGVAFIQYSPPTDSNGHETALSYNLYWGTDAAASNGSHVNFVAQGTNQDLYVQSGLTNGNVLYYKLTAVNTAGESIASSIVGPITIGATTGLNTVTGTVTLPIAATGPLMVGLYNQTTQAVYFTVIPTPGSTSVPYSVSGVPVGSYFNFAVVDMNNDGKFDLGDIGNVGDGGNPPAVNVVTGTPTTANVTLTTAPAIVQVSTDHQQTLGVSGDRYNLFMQARDAYKHAVAATIFSGPNIAVPFDLNIARNNGGASFQLNATSPAVGDNYQFLITFSDGTTQVMSGSVSAILNSFAQNLGETTTGSYTRNIPLLTWSAPAAPPSGYTYSINFYSTSGGSLNWYYSGSGNGNGLPSSQTSVLFNVDGSASSSSLTTGTTYNYGVQVNDANNNSATYNVLYTP